MSSGPNNPRRGAASRRGMFPYLRLYTRVWLDDTRELSLEDRGTLSGLYALFSEYGAPLSKTDGWFAHQLGVSTRKWRSSRDRLLAVGPLTDTPDGLTIEAIEDELRARTDERERNRRVALEREAERRNRNFEGGSQRNSRRLDAEPAANDARTHFENSKFDNENNKTEANPVPGPWHNARSRGNHHHQIKEIEKDTTVVPSSAAHDGPLSEIFNSGLIDDDDPSRRELSPRVVEELKLKLGAQNANELVAEYLGSTYARGARAINRAFIGWLKKTYGVTISGRGAAMSLGQMIDAGGGGIQLPNGQQLAKRRQGLTATEVSDE